MGKDRFSLDGKVALVTGGGRGLGRAFCEALAEAGAAVVCTGRNEGDIKETVKLISRFGHEALAIRADVSVPEDIEHMVKETVLRFGKLDIAVNNAAIMSKPCRFHQMPLEDWQTVITVDLTGVFLCMCEEIKVMLKQGGGSIINISSVSGMAAMSPGISPRVNHVAAKHGIIGLTRQGAIEYAEDNIRVNSIAPGRFEGTGSSRVRAAVTTAEEQQKVREHHLEMIPMKRTGDIEDIKGIVIYLASDASSYVTGQVFTVDGGVTAY